jgi:hypothetical protein
VKNFYFPSEQVGSNGNVSDVPSGDASSNSYGTSTIMIDGTSWFSSVLSNKCQGSASKQTTIALFLIV